MTRGILLVSAAMLLSACAGSAGSSSRSVLLNAAWTPAPGQTCQLLDTPAILPEAAHLLDLDRAQAVLSSAYASSGKSSYAVLEIGFDSLRARTRAVVLESNLPEPSEQLLLATLAEYAPEPAGEPGRGWGVLLRAEAGAPAEFRVDRMEYCACAAMNATEIQRRLEDMVRRLQNPVLAGTKRTIVVDVRSDSLGNILEKKLHQSTGHVAVDQEIARILDRLRVAPPLINRRPMHGWSRLPIIIEFPPL